MKIKFLDTQTNQTAWSNYPFDIYWWSEGNGACDCNRAILFGHEDTCGDSPYRYQAIEVVDDEEITIEQQFQIVNEDLRESYHLKTKDDILRVINEGLY